MVFGASSGIGLETARAFAREGASVLMAARRASVVEEEARRLGERGMRAHALGADVGIKGEVEAAVSTALSAFGRIDVLVNAAGINVKNRKLTDLNDEAYQALIQTNLTGAYYTIQAVLPQMRAQGGGLIVQIGSVSGRFGDRSGVVYQATKHGMLGLCYGVMAEEHAHGIRATVVEPGLVDTPLMAFRPVPPSAETLAKALRPEDIAQTCVFLAALPPRAYVPEITLLPGALTYVGRTEA